MEQPPGFQDNEFHDHVCHLNKAIYGLKQAPRAWFDRFSSFLLQSGFQCSSANPSLFVHHSHQGTMVLFLYVDDIILTGSSSSLIQNFTASLHDEFAMKDLGSLHYFLGVQVSSVPSGLFLQQTKYAIDILE